MQSAVHLYHITPEEVIRRGLRLAESLPTYQLVPQAFRYLQKHGLEQTRDLFIEDPSRYMREIQKM